MIDARSIPSAHARRRRAGGERGSKVAFGALGIAVLLSLVVAAACSSGLRTSLLGIDRDPDDAAKQGNVSFGFDPGFALTHPITGVDVAGGVVPTAGGGEKSLAFFAFVTQAAADDGDGQGSALDRGGATDSNGASDVFLAAVVDTDVDASAFMSGLVHTFRHPRCVTCHSMNFADTLAFRSAERDGRPHQGPRPPIDPGATEDGPADGAACTNCHVGVDDWRAPIGARDFRTKSNRELFDAFTDPDNLPEGETLLDHFTKDSRIDWALGEPGKNGEPPGTLPFGNVADDDHDDVLEPEDKDGVARTVPGGKARFTEQVQAFFDGGMKFSSADTAINDIVLCSQSQGGGAAADGQSFTPSVRYVPNDAFDPNTPGSRAGSVFVAFASDATDLVAGDTNGVTDVFRAQVDVVLLADGKFDLQVVTPAVMVSVPATLLLGGGDGAATAPSIGGNKGELIAFESTAQNLVAGFVDQNDDEPDVYVRDLNRGVTLLVSRSVAGATIGGLDGASNRPSVTFDGKGVAFDSAATDLAPDDTNGVRDVFWAIYYGGALPDFGRASFSVTTNDGQGSGGDCRNATIVVHDFMQNDVSVAFESDKTDLVADRPPAPTTTNVYLHRSKKSPRTVLLNRRFGPGDPAPVLGSATAADGSPAPADSFAPQLSPDAQSVAFQTLADNLDVQRPSDLNRAADVVIADLGQLDSNGFVLPARVSVSAQGADGDGASTGPVFASFAGASPKSQFAPGLVTYVTEARNTGATDDLGNVITFVAETSGAAAEFTAEPLPPDGDGLLVDDAFKGGTPLTVQFRSLSRGDPQAFRWEFGDGEISTLQNPVHSYAAAGKYTVRLRIQTGDGAILTETKADFVQLFEQPDAAFEIDPPDADVEPVTVQFANQTVTDPDDTIQWEWDFGDGSTGDERFERDPSHQYQTAGVYTVSLKVTGFGGTDTTPPPRQRTVTVFDQVTAEFTPDSQLVIQSGDSVSFTDMSTGDLLASDAWEWDFGDGSMGDDRFEQNPTHTFTDPGPKNVTLTVYGQSADPSRSMSNRNRDSETKNGLVVVQGNLNAQFDVDCQSGQCQEPGPGFAIHGYPPFTVRFTDTSTGSVMVDNRNWTFGDGDVENNGPSPTTHQYDLADAGGTYTAKLEVNGPNGENDVTEGSDAKLIRVYTPITPSFTFSPNSPFYRVNFTNTTTGDVRLPSTSAYAWDLDGDGQFDDSFAQNPTNIVYPNAGTFMVRLRVFDRIGDSVDSAAVPVTVTAKTFGEVFTLFDSTIQTTCNTAACHDAVSPAGGLDLSTEPIAYRELVGRVGEPPDPPGCGGEDHVIEGDPDGSYLVKKLLPLPPCGGRMPVGGPFLTQDQVDIVRSWISNGADEN